MANTENLTCVLYGIGDVRMENTPIPEINENECLLRMAKVGLCGTDISFITKGKVAHWSDKEPRILGHESSAVVEKCGSAVKNLKPGDRVCIEPGSPCRICEFCTSGRYNLCDGCELCTSPPAHGSLRRYYKHPADLLLKLPDNVSFEEGAMIEPLNVCVYACIRANLTLGSHVLICGAGPIGLTTLVTVKAMGATRICVTDIVDNRLKLAKELGATCTLNVKSGTPEDLAKEVAKLMGGSMPNVTMECSGAEASVRLGIFATRRGGKFLTVGLGAPEIKFPIVHSAVREIDVIGCFRYANCYPIALDLVASGVIDVKPLITHRYKLEDSVKAFEDFKTGADGCLKIMVSC